MARKRPSIETRIRSALRRAWYWYGDNRKQALSGARKRLGVYECVACRREVRKGQFQVDHTEPCGRLETGLTNLHEFAARMFFGPCTVMCRDCHRAKTADERRRRKR